MSEIVSAVFGYKITTQKMPALKPLEWLRLEASNDRNKSAREIIRYPLLPQKKPTPKDTPLSFTESQEKNSKAVWGSAGKNWLNEEDGKLRGGEIRERRTSTKRRNKSRLGLAWQILTKNLNFRVSN